MTRRRMRRCSGRSRRLYAGPARDSSCGLRTTSTILRSATRWSTPSNPWRAPGRLECAPETGREVPNESFARAFRPPHGSPYEPALVTGPRGTAHGCRQIRARGRKLATDAGSAEPAPTDSTPQLARGKNRRRMALSEMASDALRETFEERRGIVGARRRFGVELHGKNLLFRDLEPGQRSVEQ